MPRALLRPGRGHLLGVALALAASGCTTLLPGDVPRLGEAGLDAGDDGGFDGGTEGGVDGGGDAGLDGGMDADLHVDEGLYDGDGGVQQVVAGLRHSCVRLADRTVACWGRGPAAGLVETASRIPSSAGGPLGGVTDLCAGHDFGCAVADGEVHCWGQNDGLQLGAALEPRVMASRVAVPVPLPAELRAIAVGVECGARHACAIVEVEGVPDGGPLVLDADVPDGGDAGPAHAVYGRAVVCWGDNSAGEVSPRAAVGRTAPTIVGEIEHPTDELALGHATSCALTRTPPVRGTCWGDPSNGVWPGGGGSTNLGEFTQGIELWASSGRSICTTRQLAGDAGILRCILPPREYMPPLPRGAPTALAVGPTVGCVAGAAPVRCWSPTNDDQRLGVRVAQGDLNLRYVDFPFSDDARDVASGGRMPTARDADGGLNELTPDAGEALGHGCYVRADGRQVRCWGANESRQAVPTLDAAVVIGDTPVDLSGL